MSNIYIERSPDYLEHHGILGQKWGIRRYQNADGTLTEVGRKRYGVEGNDVSSISSKKGIERRLNDIDTAIARNRRSLGENTRLSLEYSRKSESTNSLKKHFKYEDKSIRKGLEATINRENIEKGKKEIESLLKKASNKGYTVKEIETSRSTLTGKDVLYTSLYTSMLIPCSVLAGLPIATAGGLAGLVSGTALMTADVEGTKYKVKDKK